MLFNIVRARHGQLFQFHVEGEGQDSGKGHGAEAVGGGEEDGCVGRDEFGEDLAACATGRAGGVVEVGDGDGGDADLWSELGDGANEGGSLGADSEAVADVFDVGAGNDFAGFEAQGCADAEAGVGRIGVERSLFGAGEELGECGVEGGGGGVLRTHVCTPSEFQKTSSEF